MAFDLTALTAWTEENAEKFMSRTLLTGVTTKNMSALTGIKGRTAIPFIDDEYDEWQDGTDCGFTPVGDVAITQRFVDPRAIKINKQFCLRTLQRFFTRQILPPGQDYGEEGLGKLENQILSLINKYTARTMEVNVWQGVAGGVNPVASFNLINGLLAIIAIEIAAGTIPVAQRINPGAITQANVIAQLEAMRAALPIDLWGDVNDNKGWIMFLSPQVKRFYELAYRATFTAAQYNQEFNKLRLDGTEIELIAVPGLFTVQNAGLLTKKSNLWNAVDLEDEENELEVYMDQDKEFVRLKARWMMDHQIAIPGELVTMNLG